MDTPVLADQQRLSYQLCMDNRCRLDTYEELWPIWTAVKKKEGQRGSEESMLSARLDNDDNDDDVHTSLNIHTRVLPKPIYTRIGTLT